VLRLYSEPADERGAEDEKRGGKRQRGESQRGHTPSIGVALRFWIPLQGEISPPKGRGVGSPRDAKIQIVSLVSVALLALALALLVGAEWPRLNARIGTDARRGRARARQKANLRLVKTESDEFAEAVRRDLENLPTIERDPRS
jgi:hypothetical protein